MISPRFITMLRLSELFVHLVICLIKAADRYALSSTKGQERNNDYRNPNDRKDHDKHSSNVKINSHDYGSRNKWNLAVYLYMATAACPITKGYAETLPTTVPYYNCFVDAGRRYGVSPALLMSIAYNESRFKAYAVNVRKSERDLGVMQINSWWLPKLRRYNITEYHLTKYPCVNIHIGAWIFADIRKDTDTTSQALGIYNAGYQPGLDKVRAKYALNILEDVHHFDQLTNEDFKHVAKRD